MQTPLEGAKAERHAESDRDDARGGFLMGMGEMV
jgi:hypothetical protein